MIISTVNQKGGVGKTTTAVNLAAYLATFGKRVLLVDMDPQGNATSGIGINRDNIERCIYNVIIDGEDIQAAINSSAIAGLDVVPSTPRLAGAEVELVGENMREARLKMALDKVKSAYDFTIVDCPPSLSLLTVNALTAATDVLIPIQCEYYALEGLSHLTNTLELIRKSLNPTLNIRGIVLTMYDSRTILSEQVAQEARKHFGKKVFNAVIPRNVRLAEAPSFGQPIIFYDPTSTGAEAYEKLSRELLNGH